MNKVNINGKTYNAPDGVNVSVINNKVYFNDKLVEDFNDWKEKNIEIKIEGNCKDIKADVGNITVEGNVEGDVTSDTGNIKIRGDVRGNVKTDCGNISSHHIFGQASTDCGNINGVHNISNSIVSSRNIVNCNNSKGWFRNLIKEIFE